MCEPNRALDEAAIALKMTVLASRCSAIRSTRNRAAVLRHGVFRDLGDALKRIARYSKITNEALVFGYREGKTGSLSAELLWRSAALRQTSN